MVFNRESSAISDIDPDDLRKAASGADDERPSGQYPSAPGHEKPFMPTYPLQFTEDGELGKDEPSPIAPSEDSDRSGVMNMTVEEMQDMLKRRLVERAAEVVTGEPSAPKSAELTEGVDAGTDIVGNDVDRESTVLHMMEQKRRAMDEEAREMVPARGLGETRGKTLTQLENKIKLAKGYLEAQFEIGKPERVDDAVLDLARVEDALERLEYLKSCNARTLPETSGQVSVSDPQGHILPDSVVDGLLDELDVTVKGLMRDIAKFYDRDGKTQS